VDARTVNERGAADDVEGEDADAPDTNEGGTTEGSEATEAPRDAEQETTAGEQSVPAR